MKDSFPFYNQAIVESGSIAYWTARPISVVSEVTRYFLNKTSCDSVDCMRQIDAKTLMSMPGVNQVLNDASNITAFKAGNATWGPVVDGQILTDFPLNLLKRGEFNQNVRLMLGSNRDEGTIFMGAPHDMSDEYFLQTLVRDFGKQVGSSIYNQYPSAQYKSPWWALEEALTDIAMACPGEKRIFPLCFFSPFVFGARAMARAFSKAGAQVFLYQFNHELDELKVDPYLGVSHAMELFFVWNLHDGCFPLSNGICFPAVLTPGEYDLALSMSKAWVDFIAGVQPGPLYNRTTDLNWDWNIDSKVNANLKEKACDFLDTIDFIGPPH